MGRTCDSLGYVAYMVLSIQRPSSSCVEERADLSVVIEAVTSTAVRAITAEELCIPIVQVVAVMKC
jgi:hypothetical protein